MKKIMITGFSGFVSRHFLNYLYENRLRYEVLGADIQEPPFAMAAYGDVLKISFQKLNLMDAEALAQVLEDFRPDYILHLAAFSSVAYSWQHPADCFNNNTRIFLNLTEGVRNAGLACRILSVGSSEEYGNVTKDQLPLREDRALKPVSPYAVARVSQEMLSKVLVDSFGMDIVLTRSFNHMGPYQDQRFVIPSFVQRIMEVAASGASGGSIETGDVSIIRDFVDVRDVVRAYYQLLMDGTAGEVYNICSGRGITLEAIIDEIADLLQVQIESRINPEFVRPDDNQAVIGDYRKIADQLGWNPQIPLRQTLQDMIGCIKDESKETV